MTRSARAYRDQWPEYAPRPAETSGLPLFVTPTREMARRDSPETSREAAVKISDRITELQRRVLSAFQFHGAMTAKELECLPELADLGFSTARKRASEGVHRGWLKPTGETRAGCQVLEAAING